MPRSSPLSAWKSLREGNERFVNDVSIHPSQGVVDRAKLVNEQHPTAVLFGCGDSRVAAEIIFDQGLGDMFVVPSWVSWSLQAETQFDLFRFSDAPIMERLHFARTQIEGET